MRLPGRCRRGSGTRRSGINPAPNRRPNTRDIIVPAMTPFLIKVLMFNLTLVAFFIQVVVPVVIGSTLPVGEGGLCPNKAKPLGKLIGLTMCLFFVVLTISLCLSKLSGMAFLRLFCSSNSLVGHNKYFLDVGILAK